MHGDENKQQNEPRFTNLANVHQNRIGGADLDKPDGWQSAVGRGFVTLGDELMSRGKFTGAFGTDPHVHPLPPQVDADGSLPSPSPRWDVSTHAGGVGTNLHGNMEESTPAVSAGVGGLRHDFSSNMEANAAGRQCNIQPGVDLQGKPPMPGVIASTGRVIDDPKKDKFMQAFAHPSMRASANSSILAYATMPASPANIPAATMNMHHQEQSYMHQQSKPSMQSSSMANMPTSANSNLSSPANSSLPLPPFPIDPSVLIDPSVIHAQSQSTIHHPLSMSHHPSTIPNHPSSDPNHHHRSS